MKVQKKKFPVINVTGDLCRFEIATNAGEEPDVYELKAREFIDLPEAYAMRRQASPGRDSAASVIENLTAGRVLPVCDPRAKSIYDAALAEQAERAKGQRKAG